MDVELNDLYNVFIWNLHQHGQYSVWSLYMALINNGMTHMNKQIWWLRVSLKIKIFMWYMKKDVVLTKDNLARKNWDGSKQCCFCQRDESIHHLFFECHYAIFLWGLTHIVFNISLPNSVQHMFGPWVNQVGGKLNRHCLRAHRLFTG
jgi:hypothetical protein